MMNFEEFCQIKREAVTQDSKSEIRNTRLESQFWQEAVIPRFSTEMMIVFS